MLRPHIVIAGSSGSAGARAAYLAGLFAMEGARVSLWTKGAPLAELRGHGLTLTDHAGFAYSVPKDRVEITDDPTCFARAAVVILSTRPGEIPALIGQIRPLLRQRAVVLALLTGPPQQDVLGAELLGCDLRGAMVDFDVLALGQGCFYRTSDGPMIIGAGPGDLPERLSLPALDVRHSRGIDALQWGRLLVDLMGTINALSGLRLRIQMLDRGWRRLMADQWAEAVRVMDAHGITPQLTTTARPIASLPRTLRLPNTVFRHVAEDLIPHASALRSPVAQDLMQRVPTEVASLQGALVEMGAVREVPTPVAAMLRDVLQSAEWARQGLPDLPVRALLRELSE